MCAFGWARPTWGWSDAPGKPACGHEEPGVPDHPVIGAYREAVGLLMLALLRRLDETGVLRFDPSKTNGDYVRECRLALPAVGAFPQFVFACDEIIYGGRGCPSDSFERMNSLYERILCDAGQER